MKKRILFSFLIVLMSVASLFAQSTTFPCGFDIVHKQKMLTDRNYDSAVNRLNTRWIKYATLLSSASLTYTSSGYVYEIPMVVHVLHTGGAVGTSYNPDSTKVAQMVAYLNSAYAAVSPFPDTTSGGCRIPLKFVLAKRTPAGVATNGIVRLDASSLSGYSSYGANAATTSGVDPQVIMNFSRWNPADYFNVYCVNKIDGNDLYSTGGIAGFAYFPGYPSLDGMIVAASQVKSGSTTVAHEFGHAFSLYHTFEGDADGTACPATGSCTTTGDLICDTEPHIRESSAYPSTWCPPTGATNSCTGVAYNNVQYNIMDYTTCPPNRFTAGQRTRVLNTLNNERTGFKTSLGLVSPTKSVTSACTPTATTPGYNIGPYIVDFNGMTVWTGDSYSEAATYIDHAYTQQSVVTRGTAYTINVTTMTNKQIVKVFIDYNNDGDFADAGENVFSHSGTIAGTEVHSGSFTIPATATTCSYLRMRVVSDFISASVSDYACGPYVYGQAEDYAIYVKSDTPSATTSFSYCQGATAPALTATGTSLNWYTVATGGTGSSTAPIPNTSAVGATIYYVSQSGDSSVTCESNRTAITVNTLSTPAAPTVTGPVNYCVGATPAALSATKATATDTLYWYNTASGGIGTTVTPTPGTSSAGTTIYYVSAKNTSNCEGPRASITVNVNAAPAAPTVTSPVNYCVGATASALSATGSSLLWYTTSTGGSGLSTSPTPVTTSAGTTTYYVSQTSGGCESPRASITVNVNAVPSAPTVTSPVNYCVGATAAALSATGTSLLWYTTSTGGSGLSTAPTPVTTSAGTTTYYVSQTSGGCESARASITVNVNSTVSAPTVTSPVNYCVGSSSSALTATGTGLLWYTSSTGGTGLSTAPTPSTTSAGSITYYVSQTSGSCESPRASITVNVNAVPSAPTVTSPVSYCVGATASALSATGSSLLWYTTSSGGSGISTAPTPVTTSAGTTTYYVSQTSGGCESPRASITVNVNSTVSAPTVTSPVNYCVGATASALSATGTGLLWYTTPTGGSGISTGPTPVTTSAGATTYYVSQTSGSCESPRAAITVNVNALPTISGTLTACAGVPTTLTGSAAADTTTPWTSSDTTKAKISNTGVVTSIAAGTPTITYKNLNGCTVTATFTVNAMPAGLSVTTPVTYCQDATTSALTTPTGTSIKWYTVATGGTAATTAPTPGSTVPGIIPYYVTQTNASGCENIPRTVINVVINPKPSAVSVTAAVTSFCVGDSVVLNGSSSVFSNFGSTSFLKGTAGTGTPTVCDCPNGSVVVGYEGGVGAWIDHFDMICKPIDRFGTLGTTTTATTANGTSVGPTYVGPYLFSGTGMLVGMKARNESYTPGNFLGEITGYGQNASYIIALGDNTSGATGLTAAGGWSASSDLGTVWAPSGTVVTGMYAYNATAYYAAGVSLRYTPIGAFKYNYSWSSGDTNKNITVKTSGTYTLTVTNSLGCAASSTPLTITANPLPSITGTLNACVGLTSALTGSATPNPTTPWTSSDTTVAKVSNTGVVTGIAAGTATITYKNSNSCNAAVTFTVNGLPGTPTVTTPVTYCQGAASTVLSATKANAADTLYWYTTATGGTGSITAPTPGTAVAGTTLYYVSERNASKCDGSRAVVTVNINPTPIAPVVVSPVTYCQGTTASALNATKGTATDTLLWYTTATGGTSSFLTPTPATGTAGTFTYYVSGKSNAGCEGPRAPITVVINTTPVAPTITTPLVYCQGSTSTALSATKGNAADTLYWYTVATGGTSTTTAPTPSTTTVGSTIFYVSEKTTSNCEGPRAAITVTINTTPSAPAVTSPVNLCVGGSSTPLTATLGTATDSLLWYTVATGGTRSLTAPTPSTASAGTAIYYVSEKTSSNCESPRSAITVNINALPSAPVVSSPVVYCQGATPSALTASGTNLKWYTVATGGTGSTTAPTPSTATAGSTTYYVSQSNAVTAGSCEGPRSAITVTINATPTAPVVTSPVAYCVGSTASALTATKLAITDTIYWYTVATGGTGTTTTPTPSTASAGTTLYYVSLKTNSGCEGPRSAITVNVNALPSAPTVVTPVNLCIGSASSALTATGTNLLWYTAATGGTGSTIAPIPSTSTVSSITYYVSQTTSATGCEGSRAAITVNINPLPSAPTVVTPINLCVGGSSSALAATGTNLLWYTAATGGSGSATAPTPGTASVGSTTYYVTQTSAASVGSCESPRAAITVIVNSLPSAPVVSSPLNLCIGAAASSLAATGLNLKWYTVAAGGTGSTTAPIPLTSSLGTTSYYVSQTSAVGCEGSRATIAVTVQPLPVLTITPVGVPDFVFCDGRKVTLKANAPTAVSYQWQTLGLPIPGAVSDTISTGTKRYYGVTVKDVYGCVKIDSVLVKDDPLPVPTLSPTGVQQCEGVIITLYCKPATTGYTYEWMKDGLPLAVSPSADNTPVTLKGDYTVKVTDIYTCVKTTNVATITNYPAVLKPTITRFGSTLKLDKTYYRYQWYRNNKPIAGATGPIYTMLYDGAYFAAVTDISECGNYSDTVQISSLGVKNTNTNNVSIKLYPNPTKNIINIEAPIKVNVRVTDLVGKIIFEQKDVTSVDLEKFSDGSYFFRISDENDQLISIEKITKMSTER